MTKPTQAQIEAAENLVGEWFVWLWATQAKWVKTMPDKETRDDLVKRIAALTAAAEADPALRDFIKDTPYSEPNDGWARTPQLENFGFDSKELLAAQCKETMGKLITAEKQIKAIEAATIERCAQEIDKRVKLWKTILTDLDKGEEYAEAIAEELESAAVSIRALKEKP